MKKRNILLQAAMAAALAVTGSAYAVVTLSPTAASTPAKYASELAAANVVVTDAGTDLNLAFSPAWGVAAGNHLYVRIDLTNATFNTPLVAGDLTTSSGSATVSLSSGGGLGLSSVIYDVSDTSGVQLSDTITLAPTDLTYVNPASAATVKVNVYDSAAAANAGAAGLGFTLNDNYVTVTPALTTTFTPATNTASVADAFKLFLANASTGTAADDTIQLGQAVTVVNAVLNPLTGAAIAATDLAAGSKLVLTGVFGAASNVFLDTLATCASGPGTNLTLNGAMTTATRTAFAGVSLLPAKQYVCMVVDRATQVPAQVDSAVLTFTGQVAPAVVPAVSTATFSTILHDGTELQTPWFSTASGYISRIFLTNSGSTDAKISSYTILTEVGNVCTAGVRPTSIPANSMISVDASALCASFSGATRAAAILTIEQPTSQIQGVYQIVNPTTGAQTAYPMLRPGTN